jgi:sec-independent protein translocase protein TatA
MSTTLIASYLLALVGMPGWAEIAVLLVIGLLIFGKRLPEVGRNLGKSIVEFKKGIKGIGEDIEEEASNKEQKQVEQSKTADLPPANTTQDPAKEAKEVEEVKNHLED